MAELTRTTRAAQRAVAFTIMGESVTYRQQSRTVNNKTGVVTDTPTDTTVTALIGEIDERTVKDSGGKYHVGDKQFRVQHSEMPETPPTKSTSVVVYNSQEYLIVDYRQSGDTAVWDLICRLP